MLEDHQIQIVQDVDKAIAVMHNAGQWMADSSKNPPYWWQPQNITREGIALYAKLEEAYVILVGDKPAAAMILTTSQKARSWQPVDKGPSPSALYIHWLCVHRDFAGQGMPKRLIDFAMKQAKERGIPFVRLDTNADKEKLVSMYTDLDFTLVTVEKEGDMNVAYFQRSA